MFENYRVFKTELAGKPISFEVGKMCGLSNGSTAFCHWLLATGPHLDFRIYIPAQYAKYDTVQGDYVDPLSGDYLDKNGTRYPEVTIVYQ